MNNWLEEAQYRELILDPMFAKPTCPDCGSKLKFNKKTQMYYCTFCGFKASKSWF